MATVLSGPETATRPCRGSADVAAVAVEGADGAAGGHGEAGRETRSGGQLPLSGNNAEARARRAGRASPRYRRREPLTWPWAAAAMSAGVASSTRTARSVP